MRKFGLLTMCLLGTLLTIAQTQKVKKYVTIELFSNTFCGLCAFYDPPAIATYLQKKADVHLITIHPDVPFDDCPFYNANPTDNVARKIYYNVTATPRTFTNGTQLNLGNDLITETLIDNNNGEYSPLRIEIKETNLFNLKDVKVNVESFDTPPTGNLRLYVANVVELVNFNAQNGLTEHHNVLWQFLTSENGDAITPAGAGESITRSYQYDINNLSHSSFEANQVYTIAFIQNNDTKEVINSGSSKDIIIDADIANTDCGAAEGSIDLNIKGGNDNYSIFWEHGATTQNISNLTEGTYTVVITDTSGSSVANQFTVNCCAASVYVGNPFSGGMPVFDEIYQSAGTITSDASINRDTEFIAGERIILQSGFSTNNPYNFTARIANCN